MGLNSGARGLWCVFVGLGMQGQLEYQSEAFLLFRHSPPFLFTKHTACRRFTFGTLTKHLGYGWHEA